MVFRSLENRDRELDVLFSREIRAQEMTASVFEETQNLGR
jgi:hypothetical protein